MQRANSEILGERRVPDGSMHPGVVGRRHAAIVISEILMDLHATRGQYYRGQRPGVTSRGQRGGHG